MEDTTPPDEDDDGGGVVELLPIEQIIAEDEMTLNPSGWSPLAASLDLKIFSAPDITSIRMKVIGQNGSRSDVSEYFEVTDTMLTLTILGLYGDYDNNVELSFFNTNGDKIGFKSYTVTTGPLSSAMPDIDIDVPKSIQNDRDMILVSYFGYDSDQFPMRPFMFDQFGDIRWYLEYETHPTLSTLNYDNGIFRLKNGNLFFGDQYTDELYEIDMFGNILNSWPMPGWGFHHEVVEKPNGNFVLSVDKDGFPTIEDFLIEIDRNTKAIINVWDLNESLQNDRDTYEWTIANDWIHVNSVFYDDRDGNVIISGRTQGMMKLTSSNEVKWIHSSHDGWDMSGDGVDLNQFLLDPLDASNNPITDSDVLSGDVNHPDFEWTWYQHSAKITPYGTLIAFDNGYKRNFGTNAFGGTAGSYSRAVEYEIDETNMTVKQIWQYGKERDAECYSSIVSEVDYYPATNTIIMSSGSIAENGPAAGPHIGKVIEIVRGTQNVVFEATITSPTGFFVITFHRTEKMPMYPS